MHGTDITTWFDSPALCTFSWPSSLLDDTSPLMSGVASSDGPRPAPASVRWLLTCKRIQGKVLTTTSTHRH